MGSSLCEHCTAACCHYLALPIDQPETRRDFDDMRWYLMHDGVTIFVEEGDWYIQTRTTCRHLREDFECGIYQTRPSICREYKAQDCDYLGGQYKYDHLFAKPEEIVAFGKKHLAEQRVNKTTKRSKRRRHGTRPFSNLPVG